MTPLRRPARLLSLLSLLSAAPGCGDEAPGATPDGGPVNPDASPAADATAAADTSPPPDGAEAGRLYGDQPFSIVVLPDTQFYAQSYPDMFLAQAAWIAEQKAAMGIAFALHVGDIVETLNVPGQWNLADRAMKMLEGAGVPYVLCAGNHDVDLMRAGPMFNQTFPTARFAPALQGTFEVDRIDNAYYFLPAGSRTWLIIALEFGPRDEVVAWADQIARQHADKPAILLTHAYMYLGQQRYDWIKYPDPQQYWDPHYYKLSGTINDGEEMFQKMVSRNDNILMVFSGHATWPEGATGLLSTRRANGYYLHEMLSNYQGCPSDFMCVNRDTMKPVRGGEGMLRIVRVDPPNRRARVETYSPYLKMSRPDAPHNFDLPLE
jgi:hypothetical protein